MSSRLKSRGSAKYREIEERIMPLGRNGVTGRERWNKTKGVVLLRYRLPTTTFVRLARPGQPGGSLIDQTLARW